MDGYTLFNALKGALDNAIVDNFETFEINVRRNSGNRKPIRTLSYRLTNGLFIFCTIDESETINEPKGMP